MLTIWPRFIPRDGIDADPMTLKIPSSLAWAMMAAVFVEPTSKAAKVLLFIISESNHWVFKTQIDFFNFFFIHFILIKD